MDEPEEAPRCTCLGCGDDADKVALALLKIIQSLQELGCPAAAIVPGAALALGVVAQQLLRSADINTVHRAILKAWPRALEHSAFCRAEAAQHAN